MQSYSNFKQETEGKQSNKNEVHKQSVQVGTVFYLLHGSVLPQFY
jgi:hypothetical protein